MLTSMFRVPSNAAAPSFDATFKIGFFRWLISSSADRKEWTRRRNAAAHLARTNQGAQLDESDAREDERYTARRAELREREAQIRAEIKDQLGKRKRRA